MKKCKYCKSEIDKSAKICPVCRKRLKTSLLTWIIVGLFAIIIISSIAGGGQSLTKNLTYNVTSSAPDSSNLGYYIEGIVTNNNSREYSYVQIEFICYDKSGNNLGTAIDNTNNLLGNQTWKYKAIGMFGDVENVDHCDFKQITSW